MNTETNFDLPTWQQERYKKLEIEGRPEYKYCFHGTAAKNLPVILNKGFSFREGRPSVSVSASYSLGWTDPKMLIDKKRLYTSDVATDQNGQIVNPENEGILLVIESKKFKPYPINDGFPIKINNETFTRGRWHNFHNILANPNKEIIPENQINLDPNEVKLALKPTKEFASILADFRNELFHGQLKKDDYSQLLNNYFHKKDVAVIDRISDKKELINNILDGEVEKFIVETIRKSMLSIMTLSGENIYVGGEKKPFKPWSKDKISECIVSLTKLAPQITNKLMQTNITKSILVLNQELTKIENS